MIKTNSVVNSDVTEQSLVNPIYEEKAISIFTKAFIRLIDIIGALIGIILLIPISIYSLFNNIRTQRQGPLFYTQKRIGRNGKIFRLYKLNTDAPISEFAQFINILFGQMTLVGPRPYTTEEIPKMGSYYDVIIKAKPGLTGVYQISGKRRITFEERLDLDLKYLFNNTLKMNAKILLITIFITARQDKQEFYDEVIYTTTPEETIIGYASKGLTLLMKRVVDMIVGLIGTIFLVPFTILIWIANRFSGESGSVFYTQERVGKDGKIFKMIKFRSMKTGAEDDLQEYLEKNPEAKAEYDVYKKLKDDPRVTKVGKFLRKLSLDEVPQFLHLLSGKMTLIGPRPYLPEEVKEIDENDYELIIKCKPGITGYWQANGRSNATFEERVEMESYYAENMSILLDIKILFKTVLSVLKSEGAV
ncbi:MAG: sugar transferase [Clostridia bacterium]|nr:sugar transferase [Clostridia bacterium]